MRRTKRIASALFVLLALERRASASGPRPSARLELGTDAGLGGCKDAEAFRARVATRLGYDPFVDDAALLIRVRFLSRPPRIVARIEISGGGEPSGTRQLEEASNRCEPLSEAVAAAVAMAIDPVGRPAPVPVAEPRAAPVRERRPSVPEATPAERPNEPTLARASADPTRVELALDAIGAAGVAPGPTLGAQAGLAVRRASLSAGLEGRVEATPSATQIRGSDRVMASAYSVALVPCAIVNVLGLCLGGRFGSLETESVDASAPTVRGSLLAMAFARVVARIPLSQALALRVGGELALPFTRTTLSIDGRPAWTAPPLHGSLVIGVMWTAP